MSRSRTIIGAVVLIVAVWLLKPLFFDSTVNEPLPALTDAERFMLEELEEMTPEKVAKLSPKKRDELQAAVDALMVKMGDRAMEEGMPRDAGSVFAEGSFRDADAFHKGSGSAKVYRQPDGAFLVRLENFMVTNGPALHVYLVRDRSGDVGSGFVDLGSLKGNKGNQNYDIPEDIDVAQFKSVVIWCKPFGVTFAVAGL